MGLSCNIYKIPVNVLLPLGRNAGTGNPNKWYRKLLSFQYKRGEGYTAQGITHFPKTFHLDEPFHLNSPQNYLIFCTNDKHSCFSGGKRYHYRLTELKFFNEISYEFGIKQSEASLNVEFLRSLLRRHFAGKTVVSSTVFSWLDLSIVNTFSAKRTVTEVKIRSWLCKIHLPD